MTDTNAQGYLITRSGKFIHLRGTGGSGGVFTDGTEAEFQVDAQGSFESLWKSYQGEQIESGMIQLADGSILTTCKIYDAVNGVVSHWRGNERTGHDMLANLRFSGLSITITKGMVIKLNTAD